MGLGDSNNLMLWISIVGIVLVLVFFFFIPNQKRSKKEGIFFKNLQRGDKVVTEGGIHGVVLDTNDLYVVLQMEDGHSRIMFSKRCISFEATTHVYPKETEKTKKGKKGEKR